MAISVRASGTWAATTTQNVATTIPAGYQAGDLGILVAAWRPYSVTATINQSWVEIVDESPGTTANGVGVGSSRVYVAYKELAASETNPTLTRSGAITPAGSVIIVLQKGAGDGPWTVEKIATAVEQAMGSTAMSHALTTTAAIKASDWIFALTGVADDSATFTRATTAISGGPSWSGNVVEYPATHLSSTTGNDMAADLIYRVASTAQASGASITVTATLSAAERVASTLFRVYAPQLLTIPLLDASPALYAPTISQPSTTAVALAQAIGSVDDETAGTTTVLSVTKTITVGNKILVGFGAWYNPSTTTDPTCADNLGNTYTLDESVYDGIRGSHIFSAPVTSGGSLTTITVTHQNADYTVLIADEFSGAGAFSVDGGTTATDTDAAHVWAVSKTIPADGFGFGFTQTDSATTPTAGSASGSPSTATVLGTYHDGGGGISGSSWHALAGGSDVTGFTGNISYGASTTGLAVGAFYGAGSSSQQLTIPLLDASAALYAPTLTPKTTLTIGLLTSTSALYAPTLTPKNLLTIPLLDAGPVLYAPSLVPKNTLILGLLESTPALYAPSLTVGPVTIQLGLLDAGATLYAPTVAPVGGATQDINLGLLDAAPALYQPTLTPKNTIVLGLLTSTSALYQPTVTPKNTLTLTLLDAGAALYGPTLVQTGASQSITLGLLDASAALYAPTVANPSLVEAFLVIATRRSARPPLPATRIISPDWSLGTGITLPLLDSSPALYAPSVIPDQFVTIPFLTSTSALYAPTILPQPVTLTIPLLNAGAALYAPALTLAPYPIILPLIDAGHDLFAPTVVRAGAATQGITLVLLDASAALYAPSLTKIAYVTVATSNAWTVAHSERVTFLRTIATSNAWSSAAVKTATKSVAVTSAWSPATLKLVSKTIPAAGSWTAATVKRVSITIAVTSSFVPAAGVALRMTRAIGVSTSWVADHTRSFIVGPGEGQGSSYLDRLLHLRK